MSPQMLMVIGQNIFPNDELGCTGNAVLNLERKFQIFCKDANFR